MSQHEETARIGRTSAIEQHVQTILTALLTAGIVASVGFAWRAQSTIEAVAVRQVEHIKTTDRMLSDIRDLDRRINTHDGRLTRIEAERDYHYRTRDVDKDHNP